MLLVGIQLTLTLVGFNIWTIIDYSCEGFWAMMNKLDGNGKHMASRLREHGVGLL